MAHPLTRLLARLSRDQRGVSAVELALFIPVLTLMTAGIVDLSKGISARFALTQAVNGTLEMAANRPIVTRTDDDGNDITFDFLRQEAATAANVPIGNVTLQAWLECDGVEADDYSDTCGEDEVIARYLQLRIDTEYEPMFDFGALGRASEYAEIVGDTHVIPIFAVAAVRIQ